MYSYIPVDFLPEKENAGAKRVVCQADNALSSTCRDNGRNRASTKNIATVLDAVQKELGVGLCCKQASPSSAEQSDCSASCETRSPRSGAPNKRYIGRMEPTFKCLVVGDVGVGKTSFVQKYVYNKKVTDYKATLGGEYGQSAKGCIIQKIMIFGSIILPPYK